MTAVPGKQFGLTLLKALSINQQLLSKSQQLFSSSQWYELALQVVKAQEKMAAAGVCHLDLKFDNILLQIRNGELALLWYFGLNIFDFQSNKMNKYSTKCDFNLLQKGSVYSYAFYLKSVGILRSRWNLLWTSHNTIHYNVLLLSYALTVPQKRDFWDSHLKI